MSAQNSKLQLAGLKERRRLPRSVAGGRVLATVSRKNGEVAVVGVQLLDSNAAGLGLLCPIAVEPGDLLGLHFDATPLPSRMGRVVRCDAHGDGFRIGLVAARRAAA
ncbi:MAG: hypothetical protein KF757_05230 [Phycisphaeraceae bacterium]|nr:hypothetical protein [Phycisphaeraceae bacterium]MCW5763829.1 hypothetical protein [Phycisphaeraceae bacterium]